MIVDCPRRKWLYHRLPSWVDSEGAVYFITICCATRGINQLCHPGIAERIFETIQYRMGQKVWYPHIILLMPDHVHGLVSFSVRDAEMKKILKEWKAWTAKRLDIAWQRGFFDHRLRSDESLKEKAEYILANPVRAGLVKKLEAWSFVWFPDR